MVQSVPQKMRCEILSWDWKASDWMHEKRAVCEPKYRWIMMGQLLGKKQSHRRQVNFKLPSSISYGIIGEDECEASLKL